MSIWNGFRGFLVLRLQFKGRGLGGGVVGVVKCVVLCVRCTSLSCSSVGGALGEGFRRAEGACMVYGGVLLLC